MIALCLLAALLGALPQPGAAKPPRARTTVAAPAQAGPRLPNNVTCVFEAMGQENREIALILVVDELQFGDPENRDSPRMKEVGVLLEAAHNRCLDFWPWTAGKSGSAMAWATGAIYREANAQAVGSTGHDPAVIEQWFAAHRAEIMAARDPARRWGGPLKDHLTGIGWGEKESAAVGFGELYFVDIVNMELFAGDFAKGTFRGY
jgi:hypothetical protein